MTKPTTPSADWYLDHCSRLVTMAPGTRGAVGGCGVVPDGAIAARAGRIIWVGPARELATAVDLKGARHLDAGGRAVLPGFVDSHTHLVFAGDRAEEFHLRHAGVSYAELLAQGRGILNTVNATRQATTQQLIELA